MKKIKDLNKEIESITAANVRLSEDSKEYKRVQIALKNLRDCVRYLELKPSEEFISKERDRLERQLKAIDNGFDAWLKNTPYNLIGNKNAKTFYNSVMERSKKLKQLQNLEFILEPELKAA